MLLLATTLMLLLLLFVVMMVMVFVVPVMVVLVVMMVMLAMFGIRIQIVAIVLTVERRRRYHLDATVRFLAAERVRSMSTVLVRRLASTARHRPARYGYLLFA